MKQEELFNYITSRDCNKVWKSACEIIKHSHNKEFIKYFIPHLSTIIEKTNKLEMSGFFAPNQRFVDFAIKIIEFHKNKENCSCFLYIEKFHLSNSLSKKEIKYDGFNPKKEVKKENIIFITTCYINKKWVDYYLVECCKCKKRFKVEEREGHYMFWNWNELE